MRNVLVALSLANLLFLRAWEKSFFGGFLNDFKPDPLSISVTVVILALILWTAWHFARKSRRAALAGKIIFLLLLLLPINGLRLFYQQSFTALYGPKYWWVALSVLVLFLVPIGWAAVRRRLGFKFLVRYGVTLMLLFAPFLIFTVGRTLMVAVFTPKAPAKIVAPNHDPNKRQGSRVVWIIFDELDNHQAFKARPAGLSLPEFDRLRTEAFVASAAYPPGAQTGQSIPAYLNGEFVVREEPHGDTKLAIASDKQNPLMIWNSDMTIFSETAKSGFTTGLAGVYFPYCAILDRSVNRCLDYRSYRATVSFPQRMRRAVIFAVDAVPFVYRLWLRERQLKKEIEQYDFVRRQAVELASDPSLDLVYIHLPIPHPPGIYDRRSGRLDAGAGHSYVDNLALADVTLGSIRRAMEQSGLWDGSTVIVSSDHWWRTYFWRDSPAWTAEDTQIAGTGMPEELVPFMIKLSGAHAAFDYPRPFNTVLTRRLVLKLLRESPPSTAQQLAQWIDQNATGSVKPSWNPSDLH